MNLPSLHIALFKLPNEGQKCFIYMLVPSALLLVSIFSQLLKYRYSSVKLMKELTLIKLNSIKCPNLIVYFQAHAISPLDFGDFLIFSTRVIGSSRESLVYSLCGHLSFLYSVY